MKVKNDEIAKVVEQLGVFFERFDHTPTSARIVSYLLVVEPHYQDFESIRAFLQASKSTISTTLKSLSNKGIVDYQTLPGDRKRYFKVNPEKWLSMTLTSIHGFTLIKSILAEILEIRNKEESPEFYNGIKNLHAFFIHLDKYLDMAVQDWKKEQQS